MANGDRPSIDAFDFLNRRARWVGRLDCHFAIARLLDEFHAEQLVKREEANRECLAENIRNWVEGMQPTDLHNRSTGELQDELQIRRQLADGELCPHRAPWDDCPDCRH